MDLVDGIALGIVVVLWLGAVTLMYRGWLGRARRQAPLIGDLPTTPLDADGQPTLGDLQYGPVSGLYTGSSMAPSWQDRIALGAKGTGAWGFRAVINVSRYPGGYLIERSHGDPLWLANDAIVAIRPESVSAGKVMTRDALLVFRWRLPTGTEIDTGFRADDKSQYRQLVALAPPGTVPEFPDDYTQSRVKPEPRAKDQSREGES